MSNLWRKVILPTWLMNYLLKKKKCGNFSMSVNYLMPLKKIIKFKKNVKTLIIKLILLKNASRHIKIFLNFNIFTLSKSRAREREKETFCRLSKLGENLLDKILFTSHIFSQTRSVNETCCIFNASWVVRESEWRKEILLN